MGIDQSLTCTGWYLEEDGVPSWGTILTEKSDEPCTYQDQIDRCDYIAYELLDICAKYDIDEVNIEQFPMAAKGAATRTLPMLFGYIVSRLIGNGVHVNHTALSKLKKYATGKGNADKQQMFDALPDDVQAKFIKYPKSKGRYDLADAYWLHAYEQSDI